MAELAKIRESMIRDRLMAISQLVGEAGEALARQDHLALCRQLVTMGSELRELAGLAAITAAHSGHTSGQIERALGIPSTTI